MSIAIRAVYFANSFGTAIVMDASLCPIRHAAFCEGLCKGFSIHAAAKTPTVSNVINE